MPIYFDFSSIYDMINRHNLISYDINMIFLQKKNDPKSEGCQETQLFTATHQAFDGGRR